MIYFLRHQTTFNNKFGLVSGQADSPIIKEKIHIENDENIKNIEIVYSSPSQRCIDTLHFIPELTKLPIIDKRLMERKMGDFENCFRQDLYQIFPDFFRIINNQICFRYELTPPNGESFSEFENRISSFCSEIILHCEDRNILICSHNQTIKMMYFILKGFPPTEETWNRITFPNGKIVAYTEDYADF